MTEDESQKPRFYAVRHEDDVADVSKGLLIPPYKKQRINYLKKSLNFSAWASFPVVGILLLVGIGFFGIQTISAMNTASVPAVSIINSTTNEIKPLQYGVQVSLSKPNFFASTRDAFIESELTFIEVNLVEMQLRYFEDGVLKENFPILAKGEKGSLWQTPAGLYKVETKDEDFFSTVGQVRQPWNMTFQGNYYIHGWPEYSEDSPVQVGMTAGGIRITNENAEKLFKQTKVNTPILVHEKTFEADSFIYDQKIPELKTPRYLIADISNGTILASKDLNTIAPIASVTKLMTALVATEHINLDKKVLLYGSSFVQSLIPRLEERSKVSMYSLLQLLLVESSNEAADVIAEELGRDRFIGLMNERAQALGMRSTNFADPSGLSAENTSTLGDLFRLTQYIYANRSFILEITANQDLPTAHVSGEFGELVNFNKVDELDNFIGGKVGETIAARQTSVTLHNLHVKGAERTLAIIILGSEDRNSDVTALLHYAEDRFGE